MSFALVVLIKDNIEVINFTFIYFIICGEIQLTCRHKMHLLNHFHNLYSLTTTTKESDFCVARFFQPSKSKPFESESSGDKKDNNS
jgi:hypothetical protein